MSNPDLQAAMADEMAHYLSLIGGPDGPSDSPINPQSHWVLLDMQRKYGKPAVDEALTNFFTDEAIRNWKESQ